MTLPRDPSDDLDRLLDEGAGELGSLYRRLPRAEPPKRLDRNVLGEAARAVRSRPGKPHGWIVGFGSAAGVVLAAGIAWQVGRNVQQQSSHDAFRHRSTNVVPVEPITDASSRLRERAKEAQDAAAPEASLAPAAASPAQKELVRQAPARKPETRPAPSPPKSAPAPAAMSAAAPPPAPPPPQSPAPFPEEDALKRADRAESEVSGAGATAGAVDSRQTQGMAPTVADALDKKNEEKSRAAPAPSGSVELRRDMQLSPDDWISHIRDLVRQGRRQQALESLRLLRRMHPDVAIPAKLRALED